MVRAELRNEIIYIRLEGDITYDEFIAAVDPIFQSKLKYIGFISDGRKLATFANPQVQMKLEEHHRTHNSDKPNAIVMDALSGKAILAKIYITFTKAKNTRLFSDEAAAVAWVQAFAR